jgi:uncharacterized RDD family membrane protein YckC
MRYTGVGLRSVATALDLAVIVAIGYGIARATGGVTANGFELHGGPALLWFASGFLYYIVMEAACGATLGKLLLGLRVRGEDGAPVAVGAAVTRNVLRVVDGLFFYLPGAILVWTSPRRQRLGDRIAGTVVVRGARVAE